jgi:hypothetical protein
MVRLDQGQIEEAVVGHALVQGAPPRSVPIPQAERFLPGGILVTQLDRVESRGTYRIISDALCIDLSTYPGASCRAIYRAANGQLYQLFYGSSSVPILVTITG